MAWTQGVWEYDGASSFPGGLGQPTNVVLYNHHYYFIDRYSFSGQGDPWLSPEIVHAPNAYIKTFYDELGT